MEGSMFYVIFALKPFLIFIYNMAIDSYEHIDYTGLKNDGSTVKIS